MDARFKAFERKESVVGLGKINIADIELRIEK
jgi:hypothetical protein